jgi:tRNA(Arg) A34 adenosine deaminase TadA
VVSGARLYAQPTCHHAPETYAGISERRAAEMLKSFFRDRR